MAILGFLFNCTDCCSNKPDENFKSEYKYLGNRGVRTYLFDISEVLKNKEIGLEESYFPVNLIYRGWMLSKDQYQKLYDILLKKNYKLIVSPFEYSEAHYLDKWYPLLKDITVGSYYSDGIPNKENILEMLSKFDGKSVILKDYVKTLKYEWYESCFIEDTNNEESALNVINSFIEKQADTFSGGLVLREFVDIKKTDTHLSDGNQINEEVRVFCFDKEPFCFISYWSGGSALRDRNFLNIVDQCSYLSSDFLTIDLAKKENGEWILIDVDDGQVSSLLKYDVSKFYDCFLSVLNIQYDVY